MLSLTRTLLLEEIASKQAVGRALFAAVTQDVPFLRALIDTGVVSEPVLARYLGRSDAPSIKHVAPMYELAAQLPRGLCARFLAIPVRRDPVTGTIDVVVANADDPHPAKEIAFHLQAPVRMVRAPLLAIETALAELETREAMALREHRPRAKTSERDPWGSTLAQPQSPPNVSPARASRWPSMPPMRPPSNTPPWGTPAHQAMVLRRPSVMPPATSVRAPSLPPIGDRAARPSGEMPRFDRVRGGTERPPPMLHPTESAIGEGYAFDPSGLRPIVEVRNESRSRSGRPPARRVLEALRTAQTRDEVLDGLLDGAHEVASRVALFVVKKDGYVGWNCTKEFGDPAALRSVLVPLDAPSVFDRSVREGLYLGPIAHEEAHVALLLVMRRATRDVAVITVFVRERPAVLMVADELGDTMLATQRLEELAKEAGDALARILRTRR